MAVKDRINSRFSQLHDDFIESIEISSIDFSFRGFHSGPGNVESHHREAILHQHGYVLAVERVLSIERAIAWIVGEALVDLCMHLLKRRLVLL